MIKSRLSQALLFMVFGSLIFVMSCNEDDAQTDPPVAGFTFEVNQETGAVTFTNTSENATAYSWDFGDGTTGTQENPVKSYTQSGDYDVVLTASNDAGDSDTAEETVTIEIVVADEEAPVITLTGEAEIEIEIGDDYEDAGATANDNVDGDISSNIVVTGEVNTIQPGEYTIAYNVSDAAGNEATEVRRTVTVTFDDGLLTNGDFETGDGTGWTGNALDVRTEGGNSFTFAEVTTAGNAFDVNLSQVLPLGIGNTYELSFNASTDQAAGRTILAGIGLNEAPFTNVTEEVTITEATQRFTYEFSANFGSDNSRVLFDMGAAVGVVVIDNVSLELLSENTSALPFDFENESEVTSAFNGAAFAFDEDPDDASNKVGKITNSGAAFEGVSFFLGTAVDFSNDKQISMDFYTSTANIPVLLKFENGAAPVELSATATSTGWQELTFDFSSASGSYSQMVIFVDGPGTSAGDFFVDDIMQEASSGGGGSQGGCSGTLVAATTLPLDFEGCNTFLGSASDAAGNGTFGSGITVDVADNPDKTGINTSDYALRIEKATGADFFAGVQNSFPAGAFDITDKVLKMKIYSTKANTTFRFELALNPQTDPVTGNPPPSSVVVTDANVWTEVEVEFSGFPASADTYNQLVIKPDDDGSNQPIAATGTYYIDDMSVEAGSGGGGTGASTFCNTEVKHLGIAAETASAINLTIENVDAQSMKVSITSADSDPVDDLIVNNLTGPITGSPAVSAIDNSVSGTLSITLTWTGTPPSDVELNILWSKSSFGGNWQLDSQNTTVSFNNDCP